MGFKKGMEAINHDRPSKTLSVKSILTNPYLAVAGWSAAILLLLVAVPAIGHFVKQSQASYVPPNSIDPGRGSVNGGDVIKISGEKLFKGFNFEQVATGSNTNHSCAISFSDRLLCWGKNDKGQLGDGTTVDRNAPTNVGGVFTNQNVKNVSVNGSQTCATLASNNQLYCWGSNSYGQLGDGSNTDHNLPAAVAAPIGTNSVDKISLGLSHTCARLSTNNQLYCWGNNSAGQLGDGSSVNKNIPSPVSNPVGANAVAVTDLGAAHTCATLESSKQMYCWGKNDHGQIGDGTTADKSTPTAVSGTLSGGSIASLTLGGAHTCATVESSKQIYCWGKNDHGQIGDGTTTDKLTPTTLANPLSANEVASISAGEAHTCAIMINLDQTKCWGNNSSGQLGDGTTTDKVVPISVKLPYTYDDQRKLNTGLNFTCVETSYYYCWGNNSNGQLGNDISNGAQLTPAAIVKPMTSIKFDDIEATEIKRTSSQTLILKTPAHAPGLVTVSIDNSSDDIDERLSFTYVAPPSISSLSPSSGSVLGGNVVTINGANFINSVAFKKVVSTPATNTTCGITVKNQLYCWGDNNYGQLGDGTRDYKLTPTPVAGPIGSNPVAEVSLGGGSVCARLMSSNQLYCWGRNNNGQLGIDSTDDKLTPTPVAGPIGSNPVAEVSLGYSHACARLASSNQLYCWGANSYGQLGDGTTNIRRLPTPVYTPIGTNAVAEVSTGYYHTCARLANNNQLYCWGSNDSGQLGNNTTADQRIPVAVSGAIGTNAVAEVSLGFKHSCARLTSNNQMYCWGANSAGQLGNGATANKLVPGVVSGPIGANPVAEIELGNERTCASLASSGQLYCWGNNGSESGVEPSPTPAAVPEPIGNKAVANFTVGESSTCAITSSDSQAYCWGQNKSGQLGDGSLVMRDAPTAIAYSGNPSLQVKFGNALATDVNFISPTQITATAPAGTNTVNVQVTNPDKQSSASSANSAYTYVVTPNLISVNPSIVSTTGGDVVTVNGSGFSSNETYTVSVAGGAPITATFVSGSAISFIAPSGSAGQTASVTVTGSSSGATNTLNGVLTYASPAPSITSLNPTGGAPAGGNTVTINGANFVNGVEFKKVVSEANAFHTCGIAMNNQLYCWGNNSSGQLGDNTTAQRNIPTAVASPIGTNAVAEVSLGAYHTCARLASNNQLYCWGSNNYGQLGDNTTTNRSIPTAVASPAGTNAVAEVSLGASHTCARLASNNQLYCWGWNDNGQLGDNTTTNRSIPTAVASPVGTNAVAEVSLGGYHTCARLASNNQLYCWGYNYYGQLGDNTNTDKSIPTAVASPIGTNAVAEVSLSMYHTCARLASTNQLYCWGYNVYGQLGDNTTTNKSIPTAVASPIGTNAVAEVSLGFYHTCARLASNSQLYCWGQNGSGPLGDNTTTNKSIPAAVYTSGLSTLTVNFGSTPATNVTYVSSNKLTATAPAGTGTVDVKVTNPDGQTSAVSAADKYTYLAPPVLTSISPTTASIAGGDVITINGTGFNSNESYTVSVAGGTGIAATYVSPTSISFVAPSGTIGSSVDIKVTGSQSGASNTLAGALTYVRPAPTITSISPNSGPQAGGNTVTVNGTNFVNGMEFKKVVSGSNANHTCGIAMNNQLYCWGNNYYGQLGDNTTTNKSIPTAVASPIGTNAVAEVSLGDSHTCARPASNNQVYCWGYNGNGQLGDNTTTQRSVPTAVASPISANAVAEFSLGYYHTCARLASNNQLYCWGRNEQGQLGDNTTTNRSIPVAVASPIGTNAVAEVSLGANHTCARLASNNQLYCWGYNYYGQLGDNTTTSKGAPTSVASPIGTNAVAEVSLGANHTCARLASNNQLYCWGYNNIGELGDNTTTNRSIPTAVTSPIGTNAVAEVSLGGYHTCARLASNNQLYCWGNNGYGQLGDNTTSQRSIPTAVTSPIGTNAVAEVSLGFYHTCARLASNNQLYCWGLNNSGQLGDNTTTQRNTPTAVYTSALSALTVNFGSTPATNVTFVSSTQLTATAPAGTGTVDVKVTNADNQTTANTPADDYTYIDAPGAPTNLTSVPSQTPGTVDLSWTAPVNNGGSPITDYVIEYSTSASGPWTTFAHTASATPFASVSGLSTGTDYYFRVAAKNAYLTGPYATTSAAAQPIYITLSTSSSNVNLNVMPVAGGRVSSDSQTLSTSTNSTTGYRLTLSSKDNSTDLVNTTDSSKKLPTIGGTLTTPLNLATNTWGFRVDGLGALTGTTTKETNAVPGAFKWLGVPALSSPVIIYSASGPTTNQETKVWYGMNADNSATSGTYTKTVTYTAITQ